MRRFRKIALWVLGVAAVLLVVGWVGMRLALNSGYARDTAGSEISKLVGMNVVVDDLSVGAASTSVALTVPDPAPDTDRPFVRVGSITTDITLAGLVSGNVSPTVLNVRDAEVNLRLAEDGKILSPLPNPPEGSGGDTPLPAVHLSNSTLNIEQKGRPRFTIAGVNADMVKDGERYALTGAADDPNWGRWELKGWVNAKFSDGEIVLTAADAPLKNELLHSIPYIPPVVWENIGASGRTAAEVKFAFNPDQDFLYGVDLRPHGGTLTVPVADVTLHDVRGLIRVIPGSVNVTDGMLKLAGGTAALSGKYDYSTPTDTITLDITASDVNVKKLPESWGLPKEIEGKMKGNANLVLRILPGGKLDTQGSGTAEIQDAMFAGLPAEIKLRLKGENGRYRFDTMMAGGE